MKISLAWIFDYFEESFQDVDVKKIVDLFNRKTAEIEHYDYYKHDFSHFFIASVEQVDENSADVYCKELDKKVSLDGRSDLRVGDFCFIRKSDNGFQWATLEDFTLQKEGFVPAIELDTALAAGKWRAEIESHDYILDIDNKSINHRPDLWGHYGLAREIAATMGYNLKPLDAVCVDQPIEQFDTKSKKSGEGSFSIEIQNQEKCFRFAGLRCENVEHQASDLFMALRLMRLGIRAINAIVDLTNYVMLDVGHPMHVFDAEAFAKQEVVIRSAKKKEKLALLDGTEIELRTDDLVICDYEKPVSLAGIYGGLSSGYTDKTETLFLEVAGFDPTAVRKTAQHFKLRTEASTRFEKYLDPMQNVVVLKRFLFLAQQLGVLGKVSEPIISVGQVIEPRIIEVAHEMIEQRLGVSLDASFVTKSLESLGCKVALSGGLYSVTVPTYRMTKDISIVEDIIEEVGRLYGFDAIPQVLPRRDMMPFAIKQVQNARIVKQYCAYALNMHEVQDYLFYDESFLRELGPGSYDESKAVVVQNPVSENWKVMVTSLIPHLVKHVVEHKREHHEVRFFEWNNIWRMESDGPIEKSSLAGIFYDSENIDFYDAQKQLMGLFNMLQISVVWEKQDNMAAWYDKHRSGVLMHNGREIGRAGMLNRAFCKALSETDSFIFELDGTFLATNEKEVAQFHPWSKYQDVTQDVSLFVPLSLTVHEIITTIIGASNLIHDPQLIDFYEQDAWPDKRSVTIRYTISNNKKTLEKEEIDAVVHLVKAAVEAKQAVVR